MSSSLSGFHPLIQEWFQSKFAAPTEPQRLAWPRIAAGEHTLIAAPTGSGKTLTAFLACIDRLLKRALDGALSDETHVVYVSPLRALSNDMHRNLERPLQEIRELAEQAGIPLPPITIGLRTGDTPASVRARLVRRPRHLLVTTPESLYLMLTGPKSRQTLRTTETVIVDEIHALVRDKRGSHLALTLERLEALCERPLQRIGLSATQKPIERVAEFLLGRRQGIEEREQGTGSTEHESDAGLNVGVIDVGHDRTLDLAIETPPSELGPVCTHEQWAEVYQRIVQLIQEHRSTLIFVNTRRMAERVTHQLSELLGEDVVGSHHGSLAAGIRLDTERRLKDGQLKAVVATASLELGLDIGYIDLVIQIGSPRSIATFLQRIGRSGHSLGLIPKGRLFALTRDELLEAMALMRAVRARRLDVIPIPEAPLDVLAQQIVAEAATRECGTDELFELFRRAAPFAGLSREDFNRTLEFLSEGVTTAGGRGRAYLHHDQVGRRVRARPGARIAATSNGGAIPEIASFRVVAEPENTVVGSLDEDFAIESTRGDIFLLGNTSWRIQHVRGGDVTVIDAHGAPPTIPFWRGEAPGRTIELSEELSTLREELERRVEDPPTAEQWLVEETHCTTDAARQTVAYAAAQKAALGLLPTQRRVIFERFFDESGGMQLVVHAPFGGGINRAWGFAMRKRFCRSFDFELQATADDNGFILSLGPQHSFPIESLFGMLTTQNVRALLEQALLAVPMFQVRWRWNVTRALQVLRMRNGKKVPPALQRFRADDLLTAVFPKLTGCQENVVGDLELPDHPLVRQTMHDCLTEAVDLPGLQQVLGRIEAGEIELIPRDTREPSPFSYELLNSNVYTFLDGGEIQERRARAVTTRRSLTVESVSDLGRLDPLAIEQVRQEAQPLIRNADELHDVLLSRILLPAEEVPDGGHWLEELSAAGRAAAVGLADGAAVWVPAERWPAFTAVYGERAPDPPLAVPEDVRRDWPSAEARVAVVRGLLEVCGPITTRAAARRLALTASQTAAALEALEGEGVVLRGRFEESEVAQVDGRDHNERDEAGTIGDDLAVMQWCHRRLLARIHRLTLDGLRRQIEPVEVEVFVRFLTRQHGVLPSERRNGPSGLFEVIGMLEGLDIPAVAWERDLLPARLDRYRTDWLDELCLTGEVGWGRLFPPHSNGMKSRPMVSLTRVAPVSLWLRQDIDWLVSAKPPQGVAGLPREDVTGPTQTDSGQGGENGRGSRLDGGGQASSPASSGEGRGGRAAPGESPPATVADRGTLADAPSAPPAVLLSSPAQQVLELLDQRGALFAADLLAETRMLPTQLQDALGELVTRGLVTADGFSGLRQLIAEKKPPERMPRNHRRRMLRTRPSTAGTGRWSVWRSARDGNGRENDDREVVEQWAWLLLRRWGVMFRDLLVREAGAPPWFELLQVYRRLEARGEIRGGRFIRGVAGEQFALGETVRRLRQLRETAPAQELVVITAADPLNLVGILTDHTRVPSTASNRVAYLDGVPVAAVQGGHLIWIATPPENVRPLVLRQLGIAATPAALRGHGDHGGRPDFREQQDRTDAGRLFTDEELQLLTPSPPPGVGG